MLPLKSTIWFGSVTKFARSRAGVAWDEQPTRGLNNRDAHYVTNAKRDPPRQWCTGLRCVGPASSFCRSVIFAAALVHKTRISRSRESEDYSDSSCSGEDNGARPGHHRNNSSTRPGGALVSRAHRFYHPARVEYLPSPTSGDGGWHPYPSERGGSPHVRHETPRPERRRRR